MVGGQRRQAGGNSSPHWVTDPERGLPHSQKPDPPGSQAWERQKGSKSVRPISRPPPPPSFWENWASSVGKDL